MGTQLETKTAVNQSICHASIQYMCVAPSEHSLVSCVAAFCSSCHVSPAPAGLPDTKV
jgi:hypothetical protein